MSLSRAAITKSPLLRKRDFYVGHEQVGFIQEVMCLRKLRGGGCIREVEPGGGMLVHIMQCKPTYFLFCCNFIKKVLTVAHTSRAARSLAVGYASSPICNFVCGVRVAIAVAVFASRFSTNGRAGIVRSRGWSGGE